VTHSPGSAIRVAMTKWGDRPHWEFDAAYLGGDEHGDWLGIPAGTAMDRPGAHYVAPTNQVGLIPAPGDDVARGWLATFHDVGGPVRVYVDITSPPVWDGHVVRAVDLDLDVVRGNSGAVWVEDRDEFVEHRLAFGYPETVAEGALASCEQVLVLLTSGSAPYDGSAAAWLARLARMLDA
jgi:hypothetical protein